MLKQGINHATALGMVFFLLVAIYFAVEFHNTKKDCLDTFDKNEQLMDENKKLRQRIKNLHEILNNNK